MDMLGVSSIAMDEFATLVLLQAYLTTTNEYVVILVSLATTAKSVMFIGGIFAIRNEPVIVSEASFFAMDVCVALLGASLHRKHVCAVSVMKRYQLPDFPCTVFELAWYYMGIPKQYWYGTVSRLRAFCLYWSA